LGSQVQELFNQSILIKTSSVMYGPSFLEKDTSDLKKFTPENQHGSPKKPSTEKENHLDQISMT